MYLLEVPDTKKLTYVKLVYLGKPTEQFDSIFWAK